MTRRIAASVLWTYFGWYLAATLLAAAGWPTELSPLGGVLVGAIAFVDWRGRLPRALLASGVAVRTPRQRMS